MAKLQNTFKSLIIFTLILYNLSSTAGIPSRYSKKEYVLNFFHKLLTKIHSNAECDACIALVDFAQIAFKTNAAQDDVVEFAKKICLKFKIEDTRVCEMVIPEFRGEVLTVFDEFFLSSGEICGSFFGPSCARKPNPDVFWNVTLPKSPKPPVLPIPPPKSGSPVSRILHISDIHLDPLYMEGGDPDCGEPLCCRSNDQTPAPGKAKAGKYGDYKCDTPLITLENMLQHISSTHKNQIDYVLWTGDIPPHNVWNQSRSDQEHALDNAVDLILHYLPGVKVYPAVGNHEGSPVNSFPPPSITDEHSNAWLRDALAKDWSNWLPQYTMSTIKKGAFYSVLVSRGLRIVSINMNYCNNMNWWLLLDSVDPAGQLQWLANTLQEAEDNKEKVHIVGHIPPGSGDCLKAFSWNYYKIINRYQSTVTAQFFGHTHSDEWQIFYDEETHKTPTNIAFIGPSVTPYQGRNPGYRIYDIDGDYLNSTRVVLNHETYILDLQEANKGNLQWVLEYKAKEAYNMSSLLPSAWNDLAYRMVKDNNLVDMAYKYFWKSSPDSAHGGPCDTDSCRHDFICRMLKARSHDSTPCNVFGLKVDDSKTMNPLMDVC